MPKIDVVSYVLENLPLYNGTNDFILELKNKFLYKKGFVLTHVQYNFIYNSIRFKPVVINKFIKLHPKAHNFTEILLGQQISNGSIFVNKLLYKDGYDLHFWASTKENGDFKKIIVDKRSIIKEDIEINIDFEKYNINDRQPKDHQKEGVIKLLQNDKYILGFDMGMGKTMTAIIAALESNANKILIVCPASLKLNWKKEIMFFDKEENISIAENGDFTIKKWNIINYDILKNYHHLPNPENLESLKPSKIDYHKFDLVIADECHYLKNATSIRTKLFIDFAKKIKKRWFLTGTPITSSPIDFYVLLDLCESPLASNWMNYVKRYCAGGRFKRKGGGYAWKTNGSSNLDELREYSSYCFLRKTKRGTIDLPEKIIRPIYLDNKLSPMYNVYIDEYNSWVEELALEGKKPTLNDHLIKLIKVRQLLSLDKIDVTCELAENYIESGNKVIIFSCFKETINEIHDRFKKISVLIDGSVSSKNRDIAVEKFQNDDKIKVFCGNIVAAGVGLTLTKGSIVIFNDLDWLPSNHAQAEDRAFRIGQENDVNILYPLFDNTLDTIMYNLLRKKMKMITQVMGDNVYSNDESITKTVIDNLNNIKYN